MKKKLDKLKEMLKLNKKMLVFLLGLSIIAIATGAIFVTILSKTDQELVKDYIAKFLTNIDSNKLDYLAAFKNSFISNLIFIISIWLLGISVVGIPIMLFMYFTKAFIIGFSISNIILNYKLKGCLLSLAYIFPHQIINLFIYILLIIYAFAFSLRIIDAIFKKKTIDFKFIVNKYLIVLAICMLGILLTTLIEVFVTPVIIKTILPLIK
jgi:stage II sporulation protein M